VEDIMKKIFGSIILTIVLMGAALPLSASASGQEVAAVKKTIENAYVKGIHIDRDIPAIRKGFHEDFNMLIFRDDEIRKMNIGEWIAGIEKRKKEDTSPPPYDTTWEFPMVDVTGNAAVARVEIFRDRKHIYTDYMSLYRFSDGWKIVNKIYFSHKD
jgi:hypothetical protein